MTIHFLRLSVDRVVDPVTDRDALERLDVLEDVLGHELALLGRGLATGQHETRQPYDNHDRWHRASFISTRAARGFLLLLYAKTVDASEGSRTIQRSKAKVNNPYRAVSANVTERSMSDPSGTTGDARVLARMRERYERGKRAAKGDYWDEVCDVTGYHRKAVIRPLGGAVALACAPQTDDHWVFNIASGHGVSLNGIVTELQARLGRMLEVRHESGRALDVPISVLDVTLARIVLGWSPCLSFPDGIARTRRDLEQRAVLSILE